MVRLILFAILGFIQVPVAKGYVYQLFVSTGFSGIDDDKVSIILVGVGGAQTSVHHLSGPFDRYSVMRFTITDRDVGKLSAIKIQLVQTGVYQDYWWLSQIYVITSRQRYQFSYNKEVKYQWNTISLNCRKGFKKAPDGKCVDIDECKDSGGCADNVASCHNNVGSYTCTCPLGYRTNYENRCEDVDECRSNKGGCDEYCINTVGSFHCACHRSGFQVVDGYRCADIDECKEGKDNCDKTTTTCRNYPGGFQCKCKPGYEWKDYSSCKRKTCSHFSADRDSRSQLHPAKCTQEGQNKYEDTCKVVCNHGNVLNKPAAEITTCGKDGLWVPHPSYCIGRPCPSLKDIPNGSVQASCKIYLDGSTRYGGRCFYRCNSGYDLKGVSYRDCQADGKWSGTEPICEKRHPTPYITCPSDINVILKPGMSTADVSDQWKIPTANVKNVTAVEPPGVSSSYRFPFGSTTVRWAAVNEIGQAKFCTVLVGVKDNEKPKVVFCPEKIYKVSYSTSQVWVNISRPVFTDNVGIVRYIPPLIDGKSLSRTSGYHMTFTAVDASGNSADCKIILYVGGERCQLPPESDPPSGSMTCHWILGGTTRYCIRTCPQGEKPFGFYSWWSCGKSDGKWKSYPQSLPVPQCVGYKEVNTSLPCDVGSIRNSSFGSGCYECPPGTYDKNGACEACAEGTFQEKTGQTDCKACPSGTQSGKGAYKCRLICPPGRYSKDGLGPFCKFCSNGTYQDKPQRTSCLPCPQGTYTLHIGATFCGRSPKITKLEPGDVASVSVGGTVVLKCFSDGEPTPSVYWKYSVNGKGSKTQAPIKDKNGNPIGTQLTIGNADSSDSGSYSCMSANTHGEVTRAAQLTVAKSSVRRETTRKKDMANDVLFPRAVDQCPAGKFSADGSGPLCRVCPKDTYQDQPGETACKNCEHGTKTLQLAATSAEACGVSPVITSLNSSVDTNSREAVLDCYAHASPTPLVSWHFLEDVPSDFLGIPKLVQLVNSKGQPIGTRMVIRVVTEHNTGRYECTAVNQFGQDKETLDLKVS
nr:sushi, von Willebrand factor type A, EGF and pentraxin domain-containing protein 1-like [Pocillopora verrucosa]